MRIRRCIPLLQGFLVLLAVGAQAQSVPRDFASVGALRDVFRGRQATNMLMMEGATPVAYQLVFTPGYTSLADGASLTAFPAQLSASVNDDQTVVVLGGAYDWARSPNGNASGFADPSLTVSHRFNRNKDDDNLGIQAGVSVPSGTAVSAGAAAQSLALLWNHAISEADAFRVTVEGEPCKR